MATDRLRFQENIAVSVNPVGMRPGERIAVPGSAIIEVLDANHNTIFLDTVVAPPAPGHLSNGVVVGTCVQKSGVFRQQEFSLAVGAKLPWGDDPPAKPGATYYKVWWSCEE